MVEKKDTLLGKIKKLFGSKRADPKELMNTLRREIRDSERQCLGLEHDMKVAEAHREEVIRRGTEAARKGRSAEKSKSALRLQALNARIGQLRQSYSMIAKTQCVAELALGKLEVSSPGGLISTVAEIQKTLNDKLFSRLLDDMQLSMDAFRHEAEKMFGVEVAQLEAGEVTTFATSSPYENMFDELAAAEKAGDNQKASQLREQMMKDGSDSGEFDSLLNS